MLLSTRQYVTTLLTGIILICSFNLVIKWNKAAREQPGNGSTRLVKTPYVYSDSTELPDALQHVRLDNEIETPPTETGPVVKTAGKVDINLATVQQFETLPGIGPVLAERIVSFRETKGDFSRLDDLIQVEGIGETKLEGIRDLLEVWSGD